MVCEPTARKAAAHQAQLPGLNSEIHESTLTFQFLNVRFRDAILRPKPCEATMPLFPLA